MKYLPSVLLLAATSVVLVACVPNYGPKNEDTELRNLVRVCALEQALSEDDVLNSMIMPMHSPGNCVMACMWAQLELLDENGKIIKPALMDNIRPKLDEMPQFSKLSDNTFYNCMDEGNTYSDKCDIIAGFFNCLMRDIFHLAPIKDN
uniref:Odorant-binding protein 3 n=1 Tax=Encarsia formosa TaxID=32400 RepID=A0A514TTX1_ENCFO|nr:odorant-binding protein 3 [Encarsia formosa]